MRGPDEANRFGSVGRLSEFLEAKIVDPGTGEALPPGQKGELWLRGITIMKGNHLRKYANCPVKMLPTYVFNCMLVMPKNRICKSLNTFFSGLIYFYIV